MWATSSQMCPSPSVCAEQKSAWIPPSGGHIHVGDEGRLTNPRKDYPTRIRPLQYPGSDEPVTSTAMIRWDRLVSSHQTTHSAGKVPRGARQRRRYSALDRTGGEEMREVVRQLIRALEQDRPLVLCQVVETRGSTPQKAGAIMVVDPSGGQIGTLGGGCVENEVKQKALRQLDGASASLHAFVLDHDYAWADGLICGGKMIIVTQPVRGPEPLAYFRATGPRARAGRRVHGGGRRRTRNRRPWAAVGDRFLFDGGGRRSRAGRPRVPRAARPASPSRLTTVPGRGSTRGVAFLPSLPRVRLVIVGRGTRRPGGRRPRGAGRFRRLGGRRPSPVRQLRAIPRGRAHPGRADRRGRSPRWRSRHGPTP